MVKSAAWKYVRQHFPENNCTTQNVPQPIRFKHSTAPLDINNQSTAKGGSYDVSQ